MIDDVVGAANTMGFHHHQVIVARVFAQDSRLNTGENGTEERERAEFICEHPSHR